MFTENWIAPCGLDCSLCRKAHEKEEPCLGCTGPDTHKPEFCSVRCTIMLCERRKANHYRFCDQCPEFPCATMQEREDRYRSKYVLKESPFSNLKRIRTVGMEQFLREEKEAWTCRDCGGVISVHTGLCSGCGRLYHTL